MIKILPLALLLLCAAAPASNGPAANPVKLHAQPGTPLDAIARRLVADDLADAKRAADKPVVMIGQAQLGAATERPALFVQLQSARECGSAGCSTVVFIWRGTGYVRVLDGISGEVSLGATRHRGMTDLITATEHYAWSGREYLDTRPAPAFDLRRRSNPQAGLTPRR